MSWLRNHFSKLKILLPLISFAIFEILILQIIFYIQEKSNSIYFLDYEPLALVIFIFIYYHYVQRIYLDPLYKKIIDLFESVIGVFIGYIVLRIPAHIYPKFSEGEIAEGDGFIFIMFMKSFLTFTISFIIINIIYKNRSRSVNK
ncbi:MAG: hypothetical protein P4L45_08205 [Ignavibacteriaceae bacterium]|nr:hypothetical protein [Ignavibacteriaceae bacterium]